jgi:hypothetical protein
MTLVMLLLLLVVVVLVVDWRRQGRGPCRLETLLLLRRQNAEDQRTRAWLAS